MLKKKLFVVSDIHGDYQALIEGLTKAGFDEDNSEHLLVSCGDAFDRGRESLAVYKFLKKLTDKDKAVVLMGNHTEMLYQYLDGTVNIPWNYLLNGTNETLADFLHQSVPFETWCILEKKINEPTARDFAEWLDGARKDINEEFPELLSWLKTRPYYFETEHYIFTHAAIDVKAQDWHKPNIPWDVLIWDDGSFFGKDIPNTNKTVCIGHVGTNSLRKRYHVGFTDDKWSILRRPDGKVIALDATTIYSHQVNVLVVEDNIPNE